MKKILYIRSGPYQVNLNSYNLQEIGLARTFYDYGYQCDVMYYNKKKNFDEVIEKNNIKIKILWRKGIKLLRSGIYPQILKKDFLSQYDAIICSEYSQIMSIMLTKYHNNVYIYNGPYYNLFKIPFIEKIYDKLFVNIINKKIRKIFCKTKMSEEFLNKKGINNTQTIGVGLDIEKFVEEEKINEKTQSVLEQMENSINLLYVGQIIKRKNVEFIIRIFNEISKNNKNIKLIIIGKGKGKYAKKCEKVINKNDKIIWEKQINNSQLKYIYKASDIFLLPSQQEIFGMVLLEAMYFSLTSICSGSAGAKTLIKPEKNGIIIDEFDENKWIDNIEKLIKDKESRKKMGDSANKTINNNFMWTNIAKAITDNIKREIEK